MGKLYFKASDDSVAKKIVDFWNPYCSHLNYFNGNGHDYVITYDDTTYEITKYECRILRTDEDAKIFGGTTKFMEFPKEVQDEMINRSTSKSPIPFVICSTVDRDAGGFNWDEDSEEWDFWNEVIEERNFDLFYKHFNIKQYESRLSEQESPLRRGSSINTSGICCRKHKARVTVKSVGYKKVIGRG